ncbi:MAG: signal recognition particle-docking protein FtsY [Candidatus Midichloria sp.]|nr:MAG: signal recognition particle-docking protein FtsY [Candidatus Midichloria sp.]
MNWLACLKKGLFKTANNLSSGLKVILGSKKLDQEALEEIQDLLISADVGFSIADELTRKISKLKIEDENNLEVKVKAFLNNEIAEMLKPYAVDLKIVDKPTTIILCGVNGNGKTTTAGKLAKRFKDESKSVILAACDTFRASAVDQLVVWSKRVGCAIVTGQDKQDPSSVAYNAQVLAQEQNVDVLIVDTAGRLHNNQNLMLELEKAVKVIQKINLAAPQEIIMVIDGSTGQNALQQLEAFMKVVPITGLIITKLDSSARGGIVLTITQKYKIPIYAIGVGENIEDLNFLDPKLFADAIVY